MTSYRTCTQPAKVCFHRGPQPTYADPACHLSAVEIVEDVPERPLQRPQIKRSGSMKHALSCQGAQDCEGSLWGRVASWIRCAAAAAISHAGFPLRRAQKDLRRTAWNRCRDGSRKTMTSSSKGCGNNKCCGNSSRTVFFCCRWSTASGQHAEDEVQPEQGTSTAQWSVKGLDNFYRAVGALTTWPLFSGYRFKYWLVVVWNIFYFFAYIGKNSPNWRTPSPPTRNRFCKISF